MFCPVCNCEYREGYTRCADCDVDLVATLEEVAERPTEHDFEVVWQGDSESECSFVCAQFRDVGIPFRVNQQSRQFLKGVVQRFEIQVQTGFRDTAKQVIQSKLRPID